MLVPPPGRFSIRTCWSQLFESRSPTMRAITSVGPPAANGTTIRTGWVGQARAFARLAAMPDASADAAASALKQRRGIITMYLQQHWTTGKHSWTGRRCSGVATISVLNAIACPPALSASSPGLNRRGKRHRVAILGAVQKAAARHFTYVWTAEVWARHARCAGCTLCRNAQQKGELHTGRRHSVVLRRDQPAMADPFPGAPDRRPTHHPPDPEMAEGGHPRGRGRLG